MEHREWPVVDEQGVVKGTRRFYPAILPLSGIDFAELEIEPIWLFAIRTKADIKKGQLYYIRSITHKGLISLGGYPGTLYKMEDFCLALKVFDADPAYQPTESEAANDNALGELGARGDSAPPSTPRVDGRRDAAKDRRPRK